LTASRSYQGVRFIGQGDFQGKNRSTGALFTVWNKAKKKEDKKKDVKPASKKSRKKAKGAKKGMEKKGDKGSGKADGKKKDGKKKEKMTIYAIDASGDTIRTIKRKIKDGMNRISWRPDAKGVDFPIREIPKEKSEPGGMPILPGTYKMVFVYGEHKDSTELTVAHDPRIAKDKFDTDAKRSAMANYNETVEQVTKAYNNLKEAKKSMELYSKIIEVQPDTVKKTYKKLNKKMAAQLDSLMNLYMLPKPKKTEYRDDSHTFVDW